MICVMSSFRAHRVGWRLFSLLDLSLGLLGSEPTVWDGDVDDLTYRTGCNQVPSPPCGMET